MKHSVTAFDCIWVYRRFCVPLLYSRGSVERLAPVSKAKTLKRQSQGSIERGWYGCAVPPLEQLSLLVTPERLSHLLRSFISDWRRSRRTIAEKLPSSGM